ncbi:MAG: MBL fold metallo-hydrolase [Bacillota bacterium]
MENSQTKEIRATLLATAGVIVETVGIRLMIDGLFGKDGHPFSVVPQPLMDNLLQGFEPFGTIDYLLFTHLHPDHFGSGEAIAYLRDNTVRGVFLPVDESEEKLRRAGNGLRQWMDAHNVPFRPLSMPIGSHGRYDMEPGVALTTFNTGHMGPQYAHISNYCLLLTLGGKTLLFTGDADFLDDSFAGALNGCKVDAVFINPLFYQNPRGRAILDTVIRPRQVILYHIPFEEDDAFMMRPMVRYQMGRYKSDTYTVTALTEPNQQVVL